MSSPTKFEPIPFYIWFQENRADIEKEFGPLSENEVERCEECRGDGFIECNLGHEHECEECDGEGKRRLTGEQVLEDYAQDAYNAQVSKDMATVKRYLKEMEENHASECISK
jgi:excinuclease UvrABC ATPase subunit